MMRHRRAFPMLVAGLCLPLAAAADPEGQLDAYAVCASGPDPRTQAFVERWSANGASPGADEAALRTELAALHQSLSEPGKASLYVMMKGEPAIDQRLPRQEMERFKTSINRAQERVLSQWRARKTEDGVCAPSDLLDQVAALERVPCYPYASATFVSELDVLLAGVCDEHQRKSASEY